MFRLTDVVKHLIIINALVFLGAYMLLPQLDIPLETLSLVWPDGREYLIQGSSHKTVSFQPFQLVTHMFMHGNFNHIFFNMLTLAFLGPMIERQLGSKRFLFYYISCGVGAMLLHLTLGFAGLIGQSSIVGASGAVMGIYGAILLMNPNVTLQLLFPPIPIKAKYIVLVLIGMDLFSGIAGRPTGIAHWAHLGGVFTGMALISSWGLAKKFW